MPAEFASDMTKPDVSLDAPEVVAIDQAPIKAEEPNGEEVELAEAFEMTETHAAAPQAELPQTLPSTATSGPLMGLIGLLSLGAGAVTRLVVARTK
jgi:hypothetical protein